MATARGFAAMTKEQHKAVAQKGGRAAHALGKAHEWSGAEAQAAGRKGGAISRGGRGRLPEVSATTSPPRADRGNA